MASRKDIEAGRATVTLFANTSPLMKGLKSVQGTMNSWGKSIMGVGAGVTALGASIVGPLAAAVGVFAARGSEIADLAAKTNLSAAAVTELGFAAEQSGSNLETVGKALIAMQKNGLDPKQFDQVAAAITAIPDDVERTNAALKIFGKSGAELLPMLAEVTALRQQARDLGLIPSDQAVQDAAKIGDQFDQVKSQIIAGIFEIGAAFAPVLIPALEAITKIGKKALDWVRANAGLVRTIGAIGAGLLIAGGIITAIGAGLVAAGAVLGGIATVATTIGTVLAAVVSPVGLVVAGIVAIGVGLAAAVGYWLLFTAHGKATLAALKAGLAPLIEGIKAIGQALMSGEFKLAYEIAAKGMKIAFLSAINEIIAGLRVMNTVMAASLKAMVGDRPGMRAIIDAVATVGSSKLTGTDLAKDIADFEAMKKRAASLGSSAGGKGAASYVAHDTSYMNPAMQRLRSYGNIDANALMGQKFGSKASDPQEKANGFLKNLQLMPELLKATKDNQMAWGA